MTRFMFYPILLCITLSVLGNVEFFRGAVQLLVAISGEELPPEEVMSEDLPDEWQPVASYPAFGGEGYTNSMMQHREVDVPTSLISLEIAGSNPAAAILVSNGHVEQARENGHV